MDDVDVRVVVLVLMLLYVFAFDYPIVERYREACWTKQAFVMGGYPTGSLSDLETHAIKYQISPVWNMKYVVTKAIKFDTIPIQRFVVIKFLNISIKIMKSIDNYFH